MDYSQKPKDFNFGLDVDEAIRLRETSRYNLTQAKMALLKMGVKTVSDGQLNALPNLDVDKYTKSCNQEFSWEAEYEDGSILTQFEGAKQHHYGNIEQDKLKFIRWVSHFVAETSNTEKRVMVTLDWKTGLWSFVNGFVLQEVKGEVAEGFGVTTIDFRPKLILKMVKRESQGVEFPGSAVGEIARYYRYILGWEAGDNKVILCVEPNGYTHLWHEV